MSCFNKRGKIECIVSVSRYSGSILKFILHRLPTISTLRPPPPISASDLLHRPAPTSVISGNIPKCISLLEADTFRKLRTSKTFIELQKQFVKHFDAFIFHFMCVIEHEYEHNSISISFVSFLLIANKCSSESLIAS